MTLKILQNVIQPYSVNKILVSAIKTFSRSLKYSNPSVI